MKLTRFSLAATVIVLASAPGARAQMGHPHPPPPRPPVFAPPIFTVPSQQPFPTNLQLVAQKAKVEIGNASARVALQQSFKNPQAATVEGTYLWSVPPGAAISNLSVTLGGKKLDAEILGADQARQIYQTIVAQKRDPAILEFVGPRSGAHQNFPHPAGRRGGS